jgi:hypothetical protein
MSQPRHPAELNPKREPQRRLALKPYARAVAQVLRVSFRASPGAVLMKVARLADLGGAAAGHHVLRRPDHHRAGRSLQRGRRSRAAGHRVRHHHCRPGPVLGRVRQRGPLHPAADELPGGRHRGRPDVRAVPCAGVLALRRQRNGGPLRPRQAVLRLLRPGPGPDRGHLHAAGVGDPWPSARCCWSAGGSP